MTRLSVYIRQVNIIPFARKINLRTQPLGPIWSQCRVSARFSYFPRWTWTDPDGQRVTGGTSWWLCAHPCRGRCCRLAVGLGAGWQSRHLPILPSRASLSPLVMCGITPVVEGWVHSMHSTHSGQPARCDECQVQVTALRLMPRGHILFPPRWYCGRGASEPSVSVVN